MAESALVWMLDNSLAIGVGQMSSKVEQLQKEGVLSEILWEEKYPDQISSDQFARTREWLETASLEDVFDLWCRGQNLVGFAGTIIYTLDALKKVYK